MNAKLILLISVQSVSPLQLCFALRRVSRLVVVIALACASVFPMASYASEIHEAVRSGDLIRLRAILEKDSVLVDAKSKSDQSTPLHEAVRTGNFEAVRALIAAKADLDAKTSQGLTPLKLAKGLCRTNIASLLEANGAQMLEPPPKPRTWVVPAAQFPQPQRAFMPPYRLALRGDKALRIINNSRRTVSVRILSGNAGADLYIGPGASRSANVPSGNFELYYIFSDEPGALYKGDNVRLPSYAASGSITLGASLGNYSIRQAN